MFKICQICSDEIKCVPGRVFTERSLRADQQQRKSRDSAVAEQLGLGRGVCWKQLSIFHRIFGIVSTEKRGSNVLRGGGGGKEEILFYSPPLWVKFCMALPTGGGFP